jgi:fermentation-respiration switch protein FrsA (DUF1100 family)
MGKNPLELLGRAWRYVMAPFYPSEWKKSADEVKGMTVKKAKYALTKMSIYYLLLSPIVAMPFYNTVIFHPFMTGDYSTTEIGGVKKQDVFFKNSDGTRLHGWYFAKPGASKTVLLSHGNAGNITHRKDLCLLLISGGASVFIYDYSGFGLSGGSVSVDQCCKDSLAAYDHLTKELKVPADQIVLYGESIGTGFTSQVAAHRPCAAVILQSGFQSLPQIAREKIPVTWVYPDFMFTMNHLDTLSFVKGKHAPLLLIHGEQDNIIPCHNSKDLFAAASEPKAISLLPKAGHNDVPYNATYQCLTAITKFLH